MVCLDQIKVMMKAMVNMRMNEFLYSYILLFKVGARVVCKLKDLKCIN